MKILFCAINSKFIHSSLAPWYLNAAVENANPEVESYVFEATINEDINTVFSRLILKDFDVVGFSTYIWNKNYVLELAEKIKKEKNATVILGGPEVSYNAEEILRENDFVDYVACGEGEEIFFELASGTQIEKIEGVCYRKSGEIFISAPRVLKHDPPFPYTEKYFKSLNGRIVYLETSRGCPFRCDFCLSGRLGGVRFFDIEESKRKILLLANSGTQTVKFIDRTFNADRKRAKELFKFIIENYEKTIPNGVCFHFEIEGELVDDEMIEIISKSPGGLFQFEIGLQSFNEKTLQYINRRSNLEKVKSTIKKLVSLGNVHVHIDLIAGMHFEDFESFKKGFELAISLRPHVLQLGFLKVLHGAEMRENKEKYNLDYDTNPPYEIASTEWMTKEELLKLHILEEVVEKLYNSGRFSDTCEYIFSSVVSVFEELLKLGFYCENHQDKNTLDAFTEQVFKYFSSLESIDKNRLRDSLAKDRLSTNRMGTLPEFLKVKSPVIKNMLNELEKDKATRREKGVKRAATILLSEPKFVYVDYKNLDKVKKSYKITELTINIDEI